MFLPPAIELTNRIAKLLFLTLGALILFPASTNGQSEDPRVLELYSEAKAAQAAGDPATAALKYESILKLQPHLAAAYNNLGLLFFQQREYKKAVDLLEKGLRIDPKMPSAEALLGMSLYEMNRYAEARPHLETALRQKPADRNAELILAKDLSNLNEFDEAARHLRQLADRQPDNQEIWFLLSKIYMKLSEQALSKMNAIDPNSHLVHEMSGEVMESMKNFDGALVEYKKAVQLAPKEPGAHYRLGNIYYLLAEWDSAIAQFQAELANDPSNCKAQALIGNVLLEQKREPEQALSNIDKALALCPNLSEAHEDRGRALIDLNRNEDALRDLQIAERATPDDSTIHFFLAQAYKALGRVQDSRNEMQIFGKLEEASHEAAEKRAQEVIKSKDEQH